MMEIKKINHDFSVCKVADYSLVNLNAEYCFIGKTDEEKSLVCITGDVPANVTQRDDGWKGFRIQGILDFSLIGIWVLQLDYALGLLFRCGCFSSPFWTFY